LREGEGEGEREKEREREREREKERQRQRRRHTPESSPGLCRIEHGTWNMDGNKWALLNAPAWMTTPLRRPPPTAQWQ